MTESAWTNNEGYVQWIACVRNDGEKTVRSSKLQVAGRSGDGHVVSSTYQELRPIKPGEMIYFAGISDNGNNTESMDFSIRPSNDGRMQGGAESDLVLEVIDLSEVGSGYGSLRFAGRLFRGWRLYRYRQWSGACDGSTSRRSRRLSWRSIDNSRSTCSQRSSNVRHA